MPRWIGSVILVLIVGLGYVAFVGRIPKGQFSIHRASADVVEIRTDVGTFSLNSSSRRQIGECLGVLRDRDTAIRAKVPNRTPAFNAQGLDGAEGTSAGALKGEDSLSYGLREIDEDELLPAEEVVFSAFIDDPHKVILGRPRVRDDLIDLARNQRRFIPVVLEAHRESFRQALHVSSTQVLILKSNLPTP